MTEVVFHLPDGDARVVDAADGVSVMKAAVQNGVPGIVGECGGQAMCGTCHVLVREASLDALPPISDDEEDMLDYQVADRDPVRSRLSCQLRVGGALSGLEVDVPGSQYR